MLDNFFAKYNPIEEKGHLLYTSQAIMQGSSRIRKVDICSQMILFDDQCFKYHFDIKFAIEEGQIKFQQVGQKVKTMVFNLPLNDEKEWREFLSKKLNQQNFHQVFKPIKKIGKGSFATVFLVQKIQTKQRFAVKAFSKEAAYNQENGKQCLIKEIQILRQLNHKNIMKLEEVFESDNSLYMIFQFLKGGQLLNKTQGKHKFKLSETRQIIKCILEGVQEMHKHNIMHRDLKPENILLKDENGFQCCVADFGLAQFSNSEEYLFVRCGTPGFVAPEVINIKDMRTKYDPICDMFSVGLIFHVILTGVSIFKERRNDALVKENRQCKFNFEEQKYKHVPDEAMDLLIKMLRVNPEERITAEQALSHPFFKEANEQDKILEKVEAKTVEKKGKQNGNIEDSCVEFKMGKESVMKGNAETVNSVGTSKVSAFGKSLIPGKISKLSKFSKPT